MIATVAVRPVPYSGTGVLATGLRRLLWWMLGLAAWLVLMWLSPGSFPSTMAIAVTAQSVTPQSVAGNRGIALASFGAPASPAGGGTLTDDPPPDLAKAKQFDAEQYRSVPEPATHTPAATPPAEAKPVAQTSTPTDGSPAAVRMTEQNNDAKVAPAPQGRSADRADEATKSEDAHQAQLAKQQSGSTGNTQENAKPPEPDNRPTPDPIPQHERDALNNLSEDQIHKLLKDPETVQRLGRTGELPAKENKPAANQEQAADNAEPERVPQHVEHVKGLRDLRDKQWAEDHSSEGVAGGCRQGKGGPECEVGAVDGTGKVTRDLCVGDHCKKDFQTCVDGHCAGNGVTVANPDAHGACAVSSDGPDCGGGMRDPPSGGKVTAEHADRFHLERDKKTGGVTSQAVGGRLTLPTGEVANAEAGWATGASRGEHGEPAKLRAAGKDSTITEPSGRTEHNKDAQGEVSYVEHDQNGAGGQATCTGDCLTTNPDGSVLRAPSFTRNNPDGSHDYLPAKVTNRFGTGPDDPGSWTVSNVWNPEGAIGTTPKGIQSYRPTFGGGGGFSQAFADADGNGGGAVCDHGSGGNCDGQSYDGRRVTVDADKGGTALLYANRDGSNVGWSASSPIAKGPDRNELIPWDDIDPGQQLALDGRGYRRPMLPGEVTSMSPEAVESGRPPLTMRELDRLSPADRKAYNDSLRRQGVPQPNQDMARLTHVQDQSDLAHSLSIVGPRLPEVDAWDANHPGATRNPVLDDLERTQPGVLDRLLTSNEAAKSFQATSPHPDPGMGAVVAAKDRTVIDKLVDGYDPAREPTKEEIDAANARLVGMQDSITGRHAFRAAYLGTPDQQALDADLANFNTAVQQESKSGRMTPKRAAELTAQADSLQARLDARNAFLRPMDAANSTELTQLRDIDGLLGNVSADPKFATQLGEANRVLTNISARHAGVTPKSAQHAEYQQLVTNLAQAKYDTVESAPRSMTNSLGSARLPSTGYRDIPLAMTAATRLEDFDNHHGLLDRGAKGLKFGTNTTGWDRLAPHEQEELVEQNSTTRLWDKLSPAEKASIAAHETPQAWEERMLSSPEGVARAQYGVELNPGDLTAGEEAARKAAIKAALQDTRTLDYSAWRAKLAEEDKQKLESLADDLAVESMADRAHDTPRALADGVARGYDFLVERTGGDPDAVPHRVIGGAVKAVAEVPAGAQYMSEGLVQEASFGFVAAGQPGRHPFTDSIANGFKNTGGRWGSAVLDGDWSKVGEDYWTGTDPHTGKPVNPAHALLEDAMVASTVTGPAGVGLRGAAGRARTAAGNLRHDAVDTLAPRGIDGGRVVGRTRDAADFWRVGGELRPPQRALDSLAEARALEAFANRADRMSSAAMAPTKVMAAPIVPYSAAVRGGAALTVRAAEARGEAAPNARVVARSGLVGLARHNAQLGQAHDTLGVARGAPAEAVDAALAAQRQKVTELEAGIREGPGGSTGTTPSSRTQAYRAAAERTAEIESAYRTIQLDQASRAGPGDPAVRVAYETLGVKPGASLEEINNALGREGPEPVTPPNPSQVARAQTTDAAYRIARADRIAAGYRALGVKPGMSYAQIQRAHVDAVNEANAAARGAGKGAEDPSLQARLRELNEHLDAIHGDHPTGLPHRSARDRTALARASAPAEQVRMAETHAAYERIGAKPGGSLTEAYAAYNRAWRKATDGGRRTDREAAARTRELDRAYDAILADLGIPLRSRAFARPTDPGGMLRTGPMVVKRLGPERVDRLGDLPPGSARAAGCTGLCVVDGFVAAVRAEGGPSGLATWAGADGWLYTDAGTYAALVRERVLDTRLADGTWDTSARSALVGNELSHFGGGNGTLQAGGAGGAGGVGGSGGPVVRANGAGPVGRTELSAEQLTATERAVDRARQGEPTGGSGSTGPGPQPPGPQRPLGPGQDGAPPPATPRPARGSAQNGSGGGRPGGGKQAGDPDPEPSAGPRVATVWSSADPVGRTIVTRFDHSHRTSGIPPPDAGVRAHVAHLRQRYRGHDDESTKKALQAEHDDLVGRVQRGEISLADAEVETLAIGSRMFEVVEHYQKIKAAQLAGARALTEQLAGHSSRAIIKLPTSAGKTVTGVLAELWVLVRRHHPDAGRAAPRAVDVSLPHDGLVTRDAAVHAGILEPLGYQVRTVHEGQSLAAKIDAYRADVTIGTQDAFQFDWLRDHHYPREQHVLGKRTDPRHAYQLVDEADLLLIDEANTPRILSRQRPNSAARRREIQWADHVARQLRKPIHGDRRPAEMAIDRHRVRLTPTGLARASELAGRNLSRPADAGLRRRVENALTARHHPEMRHGRWYLREADEIVIVNEWGSPQPGRRWSGGLHEAVEFAERLPVHAPSRTIGQITPREHFRARRVGGMTGTPDRAAFETLYDGVTSYDIPSRAGRKLTELGEPLVFERTADQFARVAADAGDLARTGRPVLIILRGVADTEAVAALVRAEGVPVHVLNAERRYLPRELDIIRAAGRSGTVTVATNLAGRGHHIELDAAARQASGLHVMLTERFEIGRLGEQAKRRAARGDDPGSYREYLALDSPLLRRYPLEFADASATSRPAAGRPVTNVGTTAFDVAQRLAERRRRADLDATAPAPRDEVHQTVGLGRVGRAAPERPVRNPAGIDLAQLAAARAGEEIPGLTDQQHTRLREQVRRNVEEPAAAEDLAAAEVAALIPLRDLVPAAPSAPELAASEAGLAHQVRMLRQSAELADALRMDPQRLDGMLLVGEQLLAERGDDPFSAGAVADGPRDKLRLKTLRTRELRALVDYARGSPSAEIGRRLGVRPDEVSWFLGVAADKLIGSTGRGVRTEADVRFARADGMTAAEHWRHVRDELRNVEDDELHPAERVLWNRVDRIEEAIARLPFPHRSRRDAAYRSLLYAGVTSVAQLAGMDDAELAAAGLTPAHRTATQRYLPDQRAPAHPQIRGRHRLAALRELLPRELDDALGAADPAWLAATLPDWLGLAELATRLDALPTTSTHQHVHTATLTAHATASLPGDRSTAPATLARRIALALLSEQVRASQRGRHEYGGHTSNGTSPSPVFGAGPGRSPPAPTKPTFTGQPMRRSTASGTGLPSAAGSGGPLADGGMTEAEIQEFLDILAELVEQARALGTPVLPFQARGPPVVVLDTELARPLLAEAGLVELPERLISFGWRHPDHAPNGAIVLFDHLVHELTELHGAQLRPDSWWDAWWQGVVDHEVGFHLGSGGGGGSPDGKDHAGADKAQRTGPASRGKAVKYSAHDKDADNLVADLLSARLWRPRDDDPGTGGAAGVIDADGKPTQPIADPAQSGGTAGPIGAYRPDDNARAPPETAVPGAVESGFPVRALPELPAEVAGILHMIQTGGQFQWPNDDGKDFTNKHGQLPPKPDKSYYREYTVPTPGVAFRAKRRLVTGQSGEIYFTIDHYKFFVVVDVADRTRPAGSAATASIEAPTTTTTKSPPTESSPTTPGAATSDQHGQPAARAPPTWIRRLLRWFGYGLAAGAVGLGGLLGPTPGTAAASPAVSTVNATAAVSTAEHVVLPTTDPAPGQDRVVAPHRFDTVQRVAAGLGVTVEQLRAANPGAGLPAGDHTRLPPGLRLTIPDGAGSAWFTQRDDSLSRVAGRFELPSWSAVADANAARFAGRSPDLIYPGERLTLPGGQRPAPAQVRPPAAAQPTPEPAGAPPGSPQPRGPPNPFQSIVSWLLAAGALTLAVSGWLTWRTRGRGAAGPGPGAPQTAAEDVDALLAQGIRWLFAGQPNPAEIALVAATLGLPAAVVGSIARDEGISGLIPHQVGRRWVLSEQDGRGRNGDVGQRLEVLVAALRDGRAAEASGSGATAGPSIGHDGRHAVANPIRGPPHWLRRLGSALGSRAGSGAPTRRSRAARTLRTVAAEHRPALDRAAAGVAAAAAANRRLRAARLAAVAVPATPPARDPLATSNSALDRARRRHGKATDSYHAALDTPLAAARQAGLSGRTISALTGLDADMLGELTRGFEPDHRTANNVDSFLHLLTRFWARRHPARELTTANGPISPDDLRSTVAQAIDDPTVMAEALAVVGVGERLAVVIGRARLTIVDLSDGHFHHIGYDDPTGTNIAGFLQMLADEGAQGVITFHPIPQRGKGLAAAGGTYYYARVAVLMLGLVFGRDMLKMWGKFPDVRLLDAIRDLPPELRWRAVMGIVGARLDIPGAFGYLAAMAIVNPDLAVMVGETTIAKEAVTELLGHEAIRTVNPEWVTQLGRLVAGAALVRRAVDDGRLAADQIPAPLRAVLTEAVTDPGQVAAGLIATLLDDVDALRGLLAEAGHGTAVNDLLPSAELARLPVYNPHLRELLQASAEIGYLVVLHNDFGLARLLANARFTETAPDERYGMQLLSLLREYGPQSSIASRPAKIIIAHLGVGKWTTSPVEHLRLVGEILRDPAYAHVSFDISWNEVARHIQVTDEVRDLFIELVRRHPTRFVYGTDAVKPVSAAQYVRQAHDLEQVFRLIEQRAGPDALVNIRYANLERQLRAARQDVSQWAFDELESSAWDGYLTTFSAERQQVVADWRAEQARAQRQPNPDHTVVGPGRWDTEIKADRPKYEQLRSLRRWHNAVTPKVVKGRRFTVRLLRSALLAGFEDARAARADAKVRKQAARDARRRLRPATTTEGLLADRTGQPYTFEALMAAYQTNTALTTDPDGRWARHVLHETQQTQVEQNRSLVQIKQLRRTLSKRRWISRAVFGAGLAVGAWALLPVWPAIAVTANYVAFAVRGALSTHRTGYAELLRGLDESILERGQFDLDVIRRLARVRRKYASLDRATPAQLARYDHVTEQFLVDAYALRYALLHAGVTNADRHVLALARYSIWNDEASSALGAQAASFHGLNPHGGLLGRLTHTAVAFTWLVNLVVHLPAALMAAFGVGFGLDFWVNAVFAVADALFLAQAGTAAVTGWAGYDGSVHPRIRRLVHWGAFPTVTAANLLLAIQLALGGSWLAVPAVVLFGASAYLSKLGVAGELRLGRKAPSRGTTANVVLGASLTVLGLAGIGTANLLTAAVVAAGAGVAMWAASALDTWRSNRPPGPAPVTTRRLTNTEHRAVTSVLRTYLSTLLPDQPHGGVVRLHWDRWRQIFTTFGLPRLGDELIAYRVVDAHGRAWTVQLTHVPAGIAQLIQDGRLDTSYPSRLFDHLTRDDGRHRREATRLAHALTSGGLARRGEHAIPRNKGPPPAGTAITPNLPAGSARSGTPGGSSGSAGPGGSGRGPWRSVRRFVGWVGRWAGRTFAVVGLTAALLGASSWLAAHPAGPEPGVRAVRVDVGAAATGTPPIVEARARGPPGWPYRPGHHTSHIPR